MRRFLPGDIVSNELGLRTSSRQVLAYCTVAIPVAVVVYVSTMVWPLIAAAARYYAPYAVLPFAIVVGSMGYFVETRLRNNEKWTKEKPSTMEERTFRQLDTQDDPTKVKSLSYGEGIPQTIFERNQGYKTGFTGRSLQLGGDSESTSTSS